MNMNMNALMKKSRSICSFDTRVESSDYAMPLINLLVHDFRVIVNLSRR